MKKDVVMLLPTVGRATACASTLLIGKALSISQAFLVRANFYVCNSRNNLNWPTRIPVDRTRDKSI